MRQHSRMSAELALRFDREMAQYQSSLQARALKAALDSLPAGFRGLCCWQTCTA